MSTIQDMASWTAVGAMRPQYVLLGWFSGEHAGAARSCMGSGVRDAVVETRGDRCSGKGAKVQLWQGLNGAHKGIT